MKRKMYLAAVIAATLAGTGVQAGSLADPVVDAPVIVADATSSSSGTATVLLLAVLMSVPVLD